MSASTKPISMVKSWLVNAVTASGNENVRRKAPDMHTTTTRTERIIAAVLPRLVCRAVKSAPFGKPAFVAVAEGDRIHIQGLP